MADRKLNQSKPIALELIRVEEPVDAEAVVRHYVAMCLEQLGVTGTRSSHAA